MFRIWFSCILFSFILSSSIRHLSKIPHRYASNISGSNSGSVLCLCNRCPKVTRELYNPYSNACNEVSTDSIIVIPSFIIIFCKDPGQTHHVSRNWLVFADQRGVFDMLFNHVQLACFLVLSVYYDLLCHEIIIMQDGIKRGEFCSKSISK